MLGFLSSSCLRNYAQNPFDCISCKEESRPLHIRFFVMQRSTIDCTFISFFVETWKVASRLVEKWVIGGGLAVCVADAMLVAWPNKVLRCARLMLSLVGVCTDTDAARWLCVRLALAFAGAAIADEHGQAEAGSLARLIPMLFPSDYGELVVVLSWVVEAALLAVVTHACVRIDVDANWVVRPLAKLSSVVIGLRLHAQWKKKWKEYGSEAIAREIKQAKTFEKLFEQSNWRLVLRPTLCCQKRTGERQHERNEGRNRKRTDKF